MEFSSSLTILYGTETGHARVIAEKMASEATGKGLTVMVKSMGDFDMGDFENIQNLAAIVSTHGIGEPPIASERFFYLLQGTQNHKLKRIRYSVLALGDTEYALFCQAGKDLDHLMEKHGAERILPRVDCDVDYEQDAITWISDFLKIVKPN